MVSFDNLSHDWMLANIPLDKALLRKWLKAGFMEGGRLFPTVAGAPQGGTISPTLANMTLDGLEAELEAHFGQRDTSMKAKYKVNLCRYADDFVVTGISKELLEREVKPVIERFLAERGLELSMEKTRITSIEEGFDFLGWSFRKYQGTLLIKPSKDNVKAVLNKIRGIVKANKMMKQGLLIRLLNPVLRGWANYHRVAVAKKAFNFVDYQVWKLLWRWAKRRHPKKVRPWIKGRYYKLIGGRTGVFATETERLVIVGQTPIRRHVKIQGDANPFDASQEAYFNARRRRKLGQELSGRRNLYRLWRMQDGKCPHCLQPFKSDEEWHLPSRVAKGPGGDGLLASWQLLHPNCRQQLLFHGNSMSGRVPARTFAKA